MTASSENLAFVDTNIVLYAYDREDPRKHQIASQLIMDLSASGRLAFSAQILNELAVVLLRGGKDRKPLPISEVREIVEEVAALGIVVPVTESLTSIALGGVSQHGLSYWDSVIWAAAKLHRAGTLYTEDFQHGRLVEGVAIVNPFV